jgi:hypothetical protein
MIELRPFDRLGRFDNDWLSARDGVAIADEPIIEITAAEESEIALVDLP